MVNTCTVVPAFSVHGAAPVFVIVTDSSGCWSGAYSVWFVTASTTTCSGTHAPPSAAGWSAGWDADGSTDAPGEADGGVAEPPGSSPWLAPGRTTMSTMATMTATSPSSTTRRRRRYTAGER